MRAAALPWLVAALAAAGCNAVFGLDPPGLADDGDAAIDGDAAVDAPRIDGDPTADTDGDGVFDDLDNCLALANLDQHDEDGDRVGDACDNCPHQDNPGQANVREGDHPDQLGDACDPRPDLPGDVIVLFDGFGGSELDPIWEPADTEWQVMEDRLLQPLASGVQLMRAPMATQPDLRVETRVTVVRATANIDREIAVGVHHDDEDSAYLCAWRTGVLEEPTAALVALERGATQTLGFAAAEPVTSGRLATLHAGHVGPVVSCHAQTGLTADLQGSGAHRGGGISLRTRAAAAAFDYVLVIGLTSPR